MNVRAIVSIALAGVMPLLVCASATAEQVKLISKSKGLAISRVAAAAHGYDLKYYKLDKFGDPNAGGKSEWLFVYLCSPGPPPPGCSFMVVVNRRTAVATIIPGR